MGAVAHVPQGYFFSCFPCITEQLTFWPRSFPSKMSRHTNLKHGVSRKWSPNCLFFFSSHHQELSQLFSCAHFGRETGCKFVEEDWCQGSHRPAEAMVLSARFDSHVNTGNLTKWLKLQKEFGLYMILGPLSREKNKHYISPVWHFISCNAGRAIYKKKT